MRAIVVLFPVFAITLGNATVQSTVSLFGRSTGLSEFQVGLFFASSAVLFFLTSSIWGGLADRWGGRPAIFAGLAGGGVSFFIDCHNIYIRAPNSVQSPRSSLPRFFLHTSSTVSSAYCEGSTIACMADAAVERRHRTTSTLINITFILHTVVGALSAAIVVGFHFTSTHRRVSFTLDLHFQPRLASPSRRRHKPPKSKVVLLPHCTKRLIMPYLVFAFSRVLGLSACSSRRHSSFSIGWRWAPHLQCPVRPFLLGNVHHLAPSLIHALANSHCCHGSVRPHRLLIASITVSCCGIGLSLAQQSGPPA